MNPYIEMILDGSFEELSRSEQAQIMEIIKNDAQLHKEFLTLKETLHLVKEHPVPDPGNLYWEGFYERLEPQIEEKRKIWPIIYRAAAFIIGGIFIGYLLFNNPNKNNAQKAVLQQGTSIRPVALDDAASELLADSKILILGIVNAEPEQAGQIDFSFQKDYSGTLLQKTANLKQQLKGSPNHRVISLLNELELILLQIKNMDKKFDLPAINVIKGGEEEQSILFKIDLERLLIEAKKEQPAAKSSGFTGQIES